MTSIEQQMINDELTEILSRIKLNDFTILSSYGNPPRTTWIVIELTVYILTGKL